MPNSAVVREHDHAHANWSRDGYPVRAKRPLLLVAASTKRSAR